MINKNKTHRLMIQVTINQYNWLLKKASSLDISISQLVRWLLNKKIKDINDIKTLETNPKETIQKQEMMTDKEWNEMLNKISTPIETNNSDLPF